MTSLRDMDLEQLLDVYRSCDFRDLPIPRVQVTQDVFDDFRVVRTRDHLSQITLRFMPTDPRECSRVVVIREEPTNG